MDSLHNIIWSKPKNNFLKIKISKVIEATGTHLKMFYNTCTNNVSLSPG